VLATTWIYAGLILLLLLLIHWVGETWWVVMVLLFFPRWFYLGPLVVLALLSGLLWQPSHWLKQGAVALVIAGPVMGFSLPIHRLWSSQPEGRRVRILSYNRGTQAIDGDRLVAMLEREHVDLICFQEWGKLSLAVEDYLSKGWYRDQQGFLASRFPIVSELPRLGKEYASEDRFSSRMTSAKIRTPEGTEFILASVHLPTLRYGFERLMNRDVHGLKLHIEWWAHELNRAVKGISETGNLPFIMAGDFNMPSDNSSMATLKTAMRFGFEEAGVGYGYTRPSKYPWFRIDHILSSPEWVFTRCWVGDDYGSDHLPLLAELILPGAPGTKANPER